MVRDENPVVGQHASVPVDARRELRSKKSAARLV